MINIIFTIYMTARSDHITYEFDYFPRNDFIVDWNPGRRIRLAMNENPKHKQSLCKMHLAQYQLHQQSFSSQAQVSLAPPGTLDINIVREYTYASIVYKGLGEIKKLISYYTYRYYRGDVRAKIIWFDKVFTLHCYKKVIFLSFWPNVGQTMANRTDIKYVPYSLLRPCGCSPI